MKHLTRISLLLILVLTSFQVAQAQDGQLPPLGKDAFLNEGQLVVKYDRFTDKTKIEFLSIITGTKYDGYGLMGVCVYEGEKVTKPVEAYLGMVSISPDKTFGEKTGIIFLADGNRRAFQPQRFLEKTSDVTIDLLLIKESFDQVALAEWARASSLEGRIGQYLEFELTEKQKKLLHELVVKMEPVRSSK